MKIISTILHKTVLTKKMGIQLSSANCHCKLLLHFKLLLKKIKIITYPNWINASYS